MRVSPDFYFWVCFLFLFLFCFCYVFGVGGVQHVQHVINESVPMAGHIHRVQNVMEVDKGAGHRSGCNF